MRCCKSQWDAKSLLSHSTDNICFIRTQYIYELDDRIPIPIPNFIFRINLIIIWVFSCRYTKIPNICGLTLHRTKNFIPKRLLLERIYCFTDKRPFHNNKHSSTQISYAAVYKLWHLCWIFFTTLSILESLLPKVRFLLSSKCRNIQSSKNISADSTLLKKGVSTLSFFEKFVCSVGFLIIPCNTNIAIKHLVSILFVKC